MSKKTSFNDLDMFPPSDDEEEGSSSWREKMPPLPKFLNPTSLFAGKNTKDREYAQHRTRTPLSTERNQRDWEGVTLRRTDREGSPYEHTNYATEARFTPSGQINQPGRYVLTMSKLSLWSVAFGLFFLGVLFFGGGFIVALSLLSATPQMLSSTDHGVSIHSAVARGGALIPIDQGKQIPQKAAPLALQTPQTGEIPSVAPAPTPAPATPPASSGASFAPSPVASAPLNTATAAPGTVPITPPQVAVPASQAPAPVAAMAPQGQTSPAGPTPAPTAPTPTTSVPQAVQPTPAPAPVADAPTLAPTSLETPAAPAQAAQPIEPQPSPEEDSTDAKSADAREEKPDSKPAPEDKKKTVDLGAAAKMSIVLPKEEGVSSTDQDNFADFSIQYASFRTKDKAKEVFFSLKKMGFSPSIVRSVTDKKVWFTVKAGNFKTRDEAKQALSIVNTPELRKQNMTGIIVANNQTDRVVNP